MNSNIHFKSAVGTINIKFQHNKDVFNNTSLLKSGIIN